MSLDNGNALVGRLLLDVMGNASPIVRQVDYLIISDQFIHVDKESLDLGFANCGREFDCEKLSHHPSYSRKANSII